MGLKTFEYQDKLPSLPVPTLDETLDKYLHSISHYLSPSSLERTKALVEDFRKPGGIGRKLHALLEDRAKTESMIC